VLYNSRISSAILFSFIFSISDNQIDKSNLLASATAPLLELQNTKLEPPNLIASATKFWIGLLEKTETSLTSFPSNTIYCLSLPITLYPFLS